MSVLAKKTRFGSGKSKLGEAPGTGPGFLMKSQQPSYSTLVWQIATEYSKEARLEVDVN